MSRLGDLIVFVIVPLTRCSYCKLACSVGWLEKPPLHPCTIHNRMFLKLHLVCDRGVIADKLNRWAAKVLTSLPALARESQSELLHQQQDSATVFSSTAIPRSLGVIM